MKEESENKNNYKAVEEKSSGFGGKLVAKTSFKMSKAGKVFIKVEAGQDVSKLPEHQLALLRSNGVI